MAVLFTKSSPYKKRARFIAILWTLLIFILCLLPSKEIPQVQVPFIDKWTHFVLFGVFSFLWLCAYPGRELIRMIWLLLIATLFGWLIEWLQGYFPSLGRSKETMDVVADAVGALLGILAFYIGATRAKNK